MRGRSVFKSQVSLGHVLLLQAVTIATVLVVAVGASTIGAITIDVFRPAGEVRIASSAKQFDSIQVQGADGDTVIQTVSFTVPSGRKADILVSWNGAVTKSTTSTVGLCFASIRLDDPDGDDLMPGQMIVLDGSVAAVGGGVHGENATLQARKNGIGPGTHTVYVIAETGGVGCYYGSRSTFVIANLHS